MPKSRLSSPLFRMDEDEYESLPSGASPTDHMVAGAAAGIMEHCIIYPVDVVKVDLIIIEKNM